MFDTQSWMAALVHGYLCCQELEAERVRRQEKIDASNAKNRRHTRKVRLVPTLGGYYTLVPQGESYRLLDEWDSILGGDAPRHLATSLTSNTCRPPTHTDTPHRSIAGNEKSGSWQEEICFRKKTAMAKCDEGMDDDDNNQRTMQPLPSLLKAAGVNNTTFEALFLKAGIDRAEKAVFDVVSGTDEQLTPEQVMERMDKRGIIALSMATRFWLLKYDPKSPLVGTCLQSLYAAWVSMPPMPARTMLSRLPLPRRSHPPYTMVDVEI